MKQSGILAGLPFFAEIFKYLGCALTWEPSAIEGTHITYTGTPIKLCTVSGPVRSILLGERTSLNILSRCSGVATSSHLITEKARGLGYKGLIAGTRKTTPGFRLVEKYGLLCGGAATHRLDLGQMVMLKDNHIWSCGSITNAVKKAKSATGYTSKIEVECRSFEEGCEACEAGADIIMLDNYTGEALKVDAKKLKDKYPRVTMEASGGIGIDTVGDYICDSVDVISSGGLTQGYSCLDFSLKIQK